MIRVTYKRSIWFLKSRNYLLNATAVVAFANGRICQGKKS